MIAYNGTNAFTGLGSVSIFIFIYLFNVFLVFLLKFYILATGGKYGGQWLLEKTIKDLFFNLIFSMTMEGFFEFVIYSFLNFYSIDLNLNGEVLGVMISSFCIILACIFLPISLLWAIFSKNEKEIASKEFEDRWGALFEFLKTKSKLTRFYNLIFVLRRFLFVMLCFYKNESVTNLIILMFTNLLYGIYMVRAKAFENKYLN
jgi:hypothetical protein